MFSRVCLILVVFALLAISTPASATVITANGGFSISSVISVPFSATVATFTDDNAAATPGDFTATIDWGDGTPLTFGTITLPGGPGTPFFVTAGHTYALGGTFTVTVKIVDGPGTGTATVTDTVTVSVLPPTLTKNFSSDFGQINPGDTTPLTFALSNPNAILLSGVAFTDTLPTGLVISTPNGLTLDCVPLVLVVTPAVITATAGTNLISVSNLTIGHNGTCTLTVNVTATTFNGPLPNTTSTVTSDQAPVGDPATATGFVSPEFFWWFFFE